MSTYDMNDKEATVTVGDVEKDANSESRHSSRPPSDRLVPEDKLFLRTYHERNAGRLVIKPEWVILYRLCTATYSLLHRVYIERRELNSVTILRVG